MRTGQPSLELGPPSTSRSCAQSIHWRPTRSRLQGRAARAAFKDQSPHGGQAPAERLPAVGKAARTPGVWRPKAQPTEEVQLQQAAPPAAAAAPPASEAAPQPGLTRRIADWMPWGQAIPLASTLGGNDDDSFSDGMAGVPPPADTSSKGSWYRRGLRRGSTARQEELQLEHSPVQVDHASLQVLRQRAASCSKPGARQDGFKLGLVVEGGGMRGCVSGGALQALSDAGLRDAFDAVYGSSAGAINGTFFLSGQRHGVHIYHDHIANEEFIDLRRLISRRAGPPALNLPYLLDHVMEAVLPLDWAAVLESPVPLKVVASSLDSLRPLLLQGFTSKQDLSACLRASATVPEVAGGPVLHRGHRFVDAAVFEPVPFRSAIADGCTHVIVLCTRPAPAKKSKLDQALAEAIEAAVKRAVLSPKYMIPAWRAEVDSLVKDGLSQDEMLLRSLDEGAHEQPWAAGAHVYPIYPDARGASFSPLCIDVPTLKNGVAEGRRATLAVLRAALGGIVDFSRFEEVANIVPMPQRSSPGARTESERLWQRYMQDDDDFLPHA